MALASSTLPNGLRIVTFTTSDPFSTVSLHLSSGSRYESWKNKLGHQISGVAHFLEHLTMKGTPSMSKEEICARFEDTGSHLNAYTSREKIAYFARCLNDNIDLSLQTLGDILLHSNLNPMDVEMEKSVILREMKFVEDSQPQEVVYDMLHNICFPGHPLSHKILGTEDDVKNMTSEDLKRYIDTHYTADRLVVVGVGGVPHEKLVETALSHFGTHDSAPKPGLEDLIKIPPPQFHGGHDTLTTLQVNEPSYGLTYESVGFNHPDYYTSCVLFSLLDGFSSDIPPPDATFSTPLFQSGLFNFFSPIVTNYSDISLLGGYALTTPENYQKSVQALASSFKSMCDPSMYNPEMLELKKQSLILSFKRQYSTTDQISDTIGTNILFFGRHPSLEEVDMRIGQIQVSDCARLASQIFTNREHALATLWPSTFDMQPVNYDKIRDLTM